MRRLYKSSQYCNLDFRREAPPLKKQIADFLRCLTKGQFIIMGTPAENLEALRQNSYPGRGMVLGTSASDLGIAIQIYWIMGRSSDSRNRVFVSNGHGLSTKAADPSKVKDPSLIIYDAMGYAHGHCVVSNGHQTNPVVSALAANTQISLLEALRDWTYEPDKPNYTPRITGVTSFDYKGNHCARIAILRKTNPLGEDNYCTKIEYSYPPIAGGEGVCITTYLRDGNPLPSFQGEPYLVPIVGENPDQVARMFWELLNPDNRVSLAVKFINTRNGNSEVSIINRFQEVATTPA